MNTQPPRVLVNGVESEFISTSDRGLQFGDGLFETIRAQGDRLFYWSQHYRRLRIGADKLAIPCPQEEVLLDDTRELMANGEDCVIKIILTRGAGSRGYSIEAGLQPNRIVSVTRLADSSSKASQGVRVVRCTHRLSSNRALAGIKHLNRLDNVLARSEVGKDFDEGIVSDQQGIPVEGTMSNLFVRVRENWFTPAIDECGVEGVIRNRILAIAEQQGISIQTASSEDMLAEADEAFLCNSLFRIWPIIELAGRRIDVGAETRELQKLLQTDELRHALTL